MTNNKEEVKHFFNQMGKHLLANSVHFEAKEEDKELFLNSLKWESMSSIELDTILKVTT